MKLNLRHSIPAPLASEPPQPDSPELREAVRALAEFEKLHGLPGAMRTAGRSVIDWHNILLWAVIEARANQRIKRGEVLKQATRKTK